MKRGKKVTIVRDVLTFLLVLGMSLICLTAVGQEATDDTDTDSDEFMLEEMVVTAEFREKRIQETPLSITGFSAEMLDMRNMNDLSDIALQAPNVSLRPGNATYGSSLVAYIRGIGQVDFNPSVEPGVGIYVDDVYYATITGNILDLLDLERVEVLRGPQGTLAGRNAIGGAIKLFTRKAGGDDGYVSVTYGDYNRLDIKAAAGFDILPGSLSARVAGVSRSRDGYVERIDYACAHNLPEPGNPGGLPTYVTSGSGDCVLGTEGGKSVTAGRLSLNWIASDRFEADFAVNIVNDKSEAIPSLLVAAKDNGYSSLFDPNSGALVPVFFDNDGDGVYTPGIDIAHDNRFATPGTYYNYTTYIDDGSSSPSPIFQGGNPGQDISVYKPYVVPPINHFQSSDYTLSLKLKLTDDVSLLSVSSYREYLNTFTEDVDGSPLALEQNLQRMDHEQFTQELRLNATLFDEFADLTLGGFYLDQETNEDGRIQVGYIGFDFIHGPDIVPSTSKAAYGQLSLNLTDRLNLALGLRYSKDEKSYTFARHNPDGSDIEPPAGFFIFAGNPANSFAYGLNDLSISYSSDNWDYRVALDYDFTDNIMGYAQVATGYRAGGNNARPFNPFQVAHTFGPEKLTNYEVGMKSTLFDQLRLNASAFFNDYTDIQLNIDECYLAPVGFDTPCASLDNVGDAEVKGFEVEGVWQPNRKLMVDFSYSYIDFTYTQIAEFSPVDVDSNTPYTPDTKWSLGAQYSIELGNGMGRLTPRIDASYQDDIITGAATTPFNTIEAYTLVNGRLTWQSEDTKWELGLEVTNLTDEYYYLTIFDLYDVAGFINGQPAPPREWAFTIKRSWF